ncbi:MAG TPA: protein kinase, partial [Candidatus Sulfotelmatobacter sp.]|nr:protein kinase [Candidatus Sulfotelmatobacter sp.]
PARSLEASMTGEFAVGQHIGDYEILSILGVGGMGKVYKARNVISDRVEAMKILLPDLSSSQGLADRFLREIRLLATLNHPNIAALRTALTHENQLVMIMEFVEGETLANRLARAPLSTAEVVNYADQVLSALSYAHKQNIIHRDIKPANMMLTPQGVVKLMDFGIARSSTEGSLTTTGTTLGSLNYMPPEQVRGEAADARSDIYSFGVSLYEMLTGRLPFKGDSQYSLMTAHLNQEPQAPITLRSDLPAELNEIILMAIAKDPANRFQSADAFRAALKSVPVSALPTAGTTVTQTPRPSTGATTLMDTPTPAPTMPMSAPTPAGAVPPPSTAAAASRRGLWLAIGALIGVGVLIAGGVYIPRHVGTHADPNKAMLPANSSNVATGGTNANSEAAPATDAATNPRAPIVSLESDKGSITVDANGNVSMQSPQGSMQVDAKTGAVRMSDNSGAAATAVHAKPTGPAKSKGNLAPAGAGATQTDSTPGAPAGPSPEELAKMEDDADKLNIRAATVSHSLDTLRQQQNAAGYSLRSDMASAQERMQAYLAKGNAALAAKDIANAQKYFDLADREVSKLEKFLGH